MKYIQHIKTINYKIALLFFTFALVTSAFFVAQSIQAQTAQPDLSVDSLFVGNLDKQYTGYLFDANSTQVVISNKGDAAATNFGLWLFVKRADNDFSNCGPAVNVQSLEPGESKTFNFDHDYYLGNCSVNLQEIEYYVEAKVDAWASSSSVVDDSNTNNNSKKSSNFTPWPEADAPWAKVTSVENRTDLVTRVYFDAPFSVNPLVRYAASARYNPFANEVYEDQVSAFNRGSGQFYADLSVQPANEYHYRIFLEPTNVTSQDLIFESRAVSPLEFSEIRVSDITSNSAVISWATNKPATTNLQWGLGPDANSLSFTNSLDPDKKILKTSHKVSLNFLVPERRYYYLIEGQGDDGKYGGPGVKSFETQTQVEDPTNKPDFIVTDIQIKQASGDTEPYVYTTIKNIGNRPVPNQILSVKVVDLDTGDDYSGGVTDDFVQGYTKEVSSGDPVVAKDSGIYRLEAVVDDKELFEELNEANNTLTKEVPFRSSDDEDDDKGDIEDDSERSRDTQKLRDRIKKLERKITQLERTVVEAEKRLTKKINKALAQRVAGRILLQTEKNGEAWYVDPLTEERFYLQNGQSAYSALQAFGLGITNKDLALIPVGIEDRADKIDTDGDGLDDKLEEALGTDPNNPDTDGDGFKDGDEVKNEFSPSGTAQLALDRALANRLSGRIIIQVEDRGQAWYVLNGKRYYMKDGDLAYQIMRFLSLGITNNDLRQIGVGELE